MIFINNYTIGFHVPDDYDAERYFIENTPDIETYKRTDTSSYIWYSKTEQFFTDNKILPKD